MKKDKEASTELLKPKCSTSLIFRKFELKFFPPMDLMETMSDNLHTDKDVDQLDV